MSDIADTTDFVISRDLDASRNVVWDCFTDPARMKHWWGPQGFKVVASNMDLRPGGTYHYCLQAPDGTPMWGLFRYRQIEPRDRLVFLSSFSDAEGGITRHPLQKTWPLAMLSTFTFEDQPGGKTRFTVRWHPLDATPEEQKAFDDNHPSMVQGWGGTMDRLAAYLAEATEA